MVDLLGKMDESIQVNGLRENNMEQVFTEVLKVMKGKESGMMVKDRHG